MFRLFKLVFLITICSLSAFGQPDQRITPIQDKVYKLFDINEYDLSYNQIAYKIYVAQAKNLNPIDNKVPVLYMLDGNGQFPVMLNQIKETSANFPLIIGVGYQEYISYPKQRTQDYTIPIEGMNEGGGAEIFYQFITHVLKPFIEERYNIDTARQTLCGHSFGGLFTLYVAFNHTASFQNYVSGSPSIWWSNGRIIPKNKPLFALAPKSFTITLGEYEERPHLDKTRKELSPEIKAIKERRKTNTSARDLAKLISEEVPNTQFILFKGKSHGSSIPQLLEETLRVASDN